MSKDTMSKLYNGEHVKDKELLFIREELEIMSKLLCSMGNVFKPFFLESTLRLEQVSDYLYSRDVSFENIDLKPKFSESLNIKMFIKNKNHSFSNDDLHAMSEHLGNIQLSASKLGSRYLMLDQYIFTLLESINNSR